MQNPKTVTDYKPSRSALQPFQPYGGVEIALPRGFQDVVVGVALQPDLRGHTVEALRALLRARERHVRDGARNAPVAVFERMDGEEPHMRQRRLQNGIEYGLIVPLQKGVQPQWRIIQANPARAPLALFAIGKASLFVRNRRTGHRQR